LGPASLREARRLQTLILTMPSELAPPEFPQDDSNHHQRLEAVGEKLADVLHDLGAPLAVILGFSELMAEEANEAARVELLQEIRRQIHRITDMRDETLAFARGKREVHMRNVQLRTLGMTIARAVDRELAGTGIQSRVVLTAQGEALLDEGQLLRAVENLARNAHEAMDSGKGSSFVVTVERAGNELLLSFTDDGPGIPEQMLAHLFEPFATFGKFSGHGLGLSIVHKVAAAHGGTVRCESKPGAGTRIELRLPVLLPGSPEAPPVTN
jgi:signal transduction histidine kinase